MLKYCIAAVSTAILSLIAGLYFPWWSVAVAAFLVSVTIVQKPFRAFLTGFIAIFLLWMLLAWRIDSLNHGILAGEMSRVLPIGGSVFLLILATSLTGGLVAGFAALAGSCLRKMPQSY